MSPSDRICGVLLGTAVGDTRGLPWEGMAASSIPRPLPPTPIDGYVSDDTEQTILVAEALLESHDLDSFLVVFARKLRRWFLGMPLGIGFGTLKAALRLLVVSPRRSGVSSAGNGAAMRAALLGLCVPEPELLTWVDAVSAVTHTDLRAIDGARVAAMAARIGSEAGHTGKRARTAEILAVVRSDEMRTALHEAIDAASEGEEPQMLTRTLGIEGFVTGYAPHTVPVALFLWLRFDEAATAIDAALRLGGDTDSVAAITGALFGATGGVVSLPADWISSLRDDAVGPRRLRSLAEALGQRIRGEPVAAIAAISWPRWWLRSISLAPRLLGWIAVRRLR